MFTQSASQSKKYSTKLFISEQSIYWDYRPKADKLKKKKTSNYVQFTFGCSHVQRHLNMMKINK